MFNHQTDAADKMGATDKKIRSRGLSKAVFNTS